MKKIILGLAITALFTNCRNNQSTQDKTNVVLLQDTTVRYNNSMLTDKNNNIHGATIGAAVEKRSTVTPNKTNADPGTRSISNTSSKNNGSGAVATAPAPAKKKGMSHRARGAIVGAGAGAITGAIVNKNNHAVGALIGGAVGAASGYIIGNEVDKKKSKP